MSISKKNISIIIVTFKSGHIINNCIQSIPKDINIIIVENSNDRLFKINLEKKYPNVKCLLSNSNLGMGQGNNFGIKHVTTDYALILNPDVVLEKEMIEKIISSSQKIDTFSIIAPLSNNQKYPNYKLDKKKNQSFNIKDPFKVISVDGYAMLLNLKRINKLKTFESKNYFDENIFMYLENDDLCKRLIDLNENIFIVPQSKIYHLGAQGSNKRYFYEVELSRNWHWSWSKFYYNKKHYGTLAAINACLPSFMLSLLKYLFYLLILNKKKEIYQKKISGYFNAMLGKKSWYRPNIN